MLAAAGALFISKAAAAPPPIVPRCTLPFWALLIAFAAAERFVVHVHFRRSAHSMSLGEIPLVFALMFASGQDVVIAGVLGRHAGPGAAPQAAADPAGVQFRPVPARHLHRRASCSTRWPASPAAIDPVVWAAAALAAAANSVTAVLLISGAVSLSEAG